MYVLKQSNLINIPFRFSLLQSFLSYSKYEIFQVKQVMNPFFDLEKRVQKGIIQAPKAYFFFNKVKGFKNVSLVSQKYHWFFKT